MSNSESQKKLKEGYSIVTCPKCGKKYIASDGHECPKDK